MLRLLSTSTVADDTQRAYVKTINHETAVFVSLTEPKASYSLIFCSDSLLSSRVSEKCLLS